jgi:hypothetical protein
MTTARLSILATLSLLMALCIGGCNSYQTRTYDVTVKNATNRPIVVWLTKNGEPYEQGWLSPEEIAIESPKINEVRYSWTTIDPGQRMGVGPVKGRFLPDTAAQLRVYSGAEKFSDLLAIDRGSPDRLDLNLNPGANSFTITAPAGALHAEPGAP